MSRGVRFTARARSWQGTASHFCSLYAEVKTHSRIYARDSSRPEVHGRSIPHARRHRRSRWWCPWTATAAATNNLKAAVVVLGVGLQPCSKRMKKGVEEKFLCAETNRCRWCGCDYYVPLFLLCHVYFLDGGRVDGWGWWTESTCWKDFHRDFDSIFIYLGNLYLLNIFWWRQSAWVYLSCTGVRHVISTSAISFRSCLPSSCFL